IVVAGMEGALPSVVGGLVKVPVIAVPTSVGYGASFGGLAALLAMLNSCASGVTVVNIDNGFGAAAAASRINHSYAHAPLAPLGLREVLDVLRQAYGATVGWGVDATEGAWVVVYGPGVAENRRRRGAALVQLASVDGRQHVVRDPVATFIAVGDFPYGAGLALDGAGHDETMIEAVAQALRRFVAGMRLAEEQSAVPRARVVAGRVARL